MPRQSLAMDLKVGFFVKVISFRISLCKQLFWASSENLAVKSNWLSSTVMSELDCTLKEKVKKISYLLIQNSGPTSLEMIFSSA